MLQSDGSTVTLFSDSVISGTATVSVPASPSQAKLSAGGFSVEAGPEPRSSPANGGTTGFSALLDALEGLASSANAIVNTLDQIADHGVLWSAGSLSNSAFSSAVGGLFDSATSDLSSFVSTMSATFDELNSEVYEMTEDGLRQIFPARTGAVEELDLLQSLRKLVRGVTGLRNDVVLNVKNYWIQGTAAAVSLAAAEEALRNFGSFQWAAQKSRTSSTMSANVNSTATVGGQAESKSSTSSSSGSTATPTQYMFTTNTGTDLSTFRGYIKTLPDAGDGYQIVFSNVPWQSYVTNLTFDQANEVASQTFVNFVTLITESDESEYGAIPLPESIQKRVAADEDLQERPNSYQHLRMISVANQQATVAGAELPNYLFDPLLGRGQTIYILDAGFNTAHSELSTANGRTVTTQVVPNDLTLQKVLNHALWAPEDITDYNGHGTGVASVAGGIEYGVASKANLVLVKFRQAATNPYKPDSEEYKLRGVTEPALQWAWDWIINDVLEKRTDGNTGKFIVNMSYGFAFQPDSDTSQPLGNGKDVIMSQITVVAAGNDGSIGHSLDENTPQSLGTPSNGLITVGGVDRNGVLSPMTTLDAGKGGSITTYALSEAVFIADFKSNTGGKFEPGTSFAAPAVAGLAAYFASLPSLQEEWPANSVSTAMKTYITRYHYQRSLTPIPPNLPLAYDPVPAADSIKVAYNRAPEGLCSTDAPAKRAVGMGHRLATQKRQGSSGDVDVVVSGTIVASSLSQSYCVVKSTSLSLSSSPSATPSASANSTTLASSLSFSVLVTSSSSVQLTSSSSIVSTASGSTVFPTSTSMLTLTTNSSTSTLSSSLTSTTTPLPTSGSFVGTLTNLPTLSSASYCTEILSNGKEILHTKTAATCTYNTAEPTTSSTTNSQAPAPTIDTDQGILTCGTRTDQGNYVYWFTDGDATHARDLFCYNLTNNASPILFEPGGDTYEFGTYTPPDNVDYSITVSAKWGALDDSGCPSLNASQNTDNAVYKLCQDRLTLPINDCDTSSNGVEFWKQGGQFFRDCITWEITSTSP
ncbi:hypothetical protein LTR36_005268 [Oleoguttula mirabilis]|uniref:Peptidase S8/S53 domain-containing protein n=1 Tax=Oleoguttula mirabilis TaxID=1507867 RepID=A0AAV9JFK0_9PEZI|nr:hypothetical protein LTR36_005268 [Oleoguttula mirabilis]